MDKIITSGIKDNRNRGSVGNFLKEKIDFDCNLAFVSAYFTIYAYEALRTELNKIDKLEFLFGEPSFIKSIDPMKNELRNFKIENGNIELKNILQQKRIAKDCSNWFKDKAEIKSIKQSGLLHGKMYYIKNSNNNESAILGSSNFTQRGLGFSKNSNIELNLEIQDRRDLQDLKQWFYEIWNDKTLVEDVKNDVLKYLEQLYKNNPPEILYFKTLYHIFEQYLEDKNTFEDIETQKQYTETAVWQKLFEFQKDGVKAAINKIHKHNGCIIADSVGLGKTFEALAVIKYFEQRNHRVLVLCPKKLKGNWTKYNQNYENNIFREDNFRFDVLCHTDLSRNSGCSGDIDLSSLYWENYDLLVIDESHNFRNNNPGRKGKQSRYERLLNDVIKKGRKTKILLLSATPVNNTLEDLRNQLYFITAGNDNAFQQSLDISSVKNLISKAKQEFLKWSKLPNKSQEELLNILHSSFFLLLDELTIARSRKHIKKYYKENLAKIGNFPKRLKPESVYSDIDLKNEFPPYDEINDRILEYKLSLFTPSKYVKEEFKHLYKSDTDIRQFTQVDREKFLIGMMKSNFLKRLESSVNSFKLTLGNTLTKIDNIKEQISYLSSYDIEEIEIYDEDDEDFQSEFLVGRKLKYDLRHLNTNDWLYDIENDEKELRYLYRVADAIGAKRDAKLQELIKKIKYKVENPTTNNLGKENKKVIVFTAFSDTAKYIFNNIKNLVKNELNINIALVTGSYSETTFGKNEYDEILTNFSPLSKERNSQSVEIDVLIATDCISEGQNLQDCDYLVNYDIHWNPVRLIQRFGRIDRIGSYNTNIKMVNFWATDDLNKYINLKHRVEDRMVLADLSATGTDNILRPEEIEDVKEAIAQDLKYREKQLKKMKEEILDLEDFDENVSLTDFTLEDFRLELLRFIEANKTLLQNMPNGTNAVVSKEITMSEDKTINIADGVIFCLKQKTTSKANKYINPLQPYFLVYITFDNVIKYTFANAKKILEIFRALCFGKTEADDKLYELFDQQTDYGKNMEQFSDLLYSAISKIKEKFDTKMYSNLFNTKGVVIPENNKRINSADDFELLTWLVIV